MDKLYIVERVRSDLRNEVYELMTHKGYHELEKELTESLLNATPLYVALRAFSLDTRAGADEKEYTKQLFAFIIYREMNAMLGGFHFDRYHSFSIGDLQNQKLSELIETLNFSEFLRHRERYDALTREPEFADFAQSRQYRNLEDAITLAIKKGKVVPAVARTVAQDIVDQLHLTEDYGYLRITEEVRKQEFEFPPSEVSDDISLMRMPLIVNGEQCATMLKRKNRGSVAFVYLVTNFGSVIKGH